MTTTARLRLSATFAAMAVVYAVSVAITRSALWAQAPSALGLGVALDLTITTLAIAYFLAVRPGLLPKAALVPIFLVGLVAGRAILPADGRDGLAVLAGLWAVGEVAISVVLIARIRQVARATAAARRAGETLIAALEQALSGALGRRIGSALGVEL